MISNRVRAIFIASSLGDFFGASMAMAQTNSFDLPIVYGAAIYGTRPWLVYGEGAVQAKGRRITHHRHGSQTSADARGSRSSVSPI